MARRSTIAPPVGLDTRSANQCVSGSRRSLDQDGRQLPPHPLSEVERTTFAAYLVGAAYNLLKNRKALSHRINRAASEPHLSQPIR